VIRKSNKSDIKEIYEIEMECFNEPFDMEYFLNVYELNSQTVIYVNEINNTITSYLSVWEDGDFSHIQSLATTKKYQKSGFGSLLLNYYINSIKERNLLSCVLEVRESNKIAYNLYYNLGFKQYHVIPKFYQNGETAIAMILLLKETK
jgi:ribosomal-protein-alanine N-acetyltransferase